MSFPKFPSFNRTRFRITHVGSGIDIAFEPERLPLWPDEPERKAFYPGSMCRRITVGDWSPSIADALDAIHALPVPRSTKDRLIDPYIEIVEAAFGPVEIFSMTDDDDLKTQRWAVDWDATVKVAVRKRMKGIDLSEEYDRTAA